MATALVAASVSRPQKISSESRNHWSSDNPRLYDRFGDYVAMAKAEPVESRPGAVLDPGGLPLFRYSQGHFYNPTSMSQYGLWYYGRWLDSRRPEHRGKALAAANWLLGNQARDGCWPYRFTYTVGHMGAGPGATLSPPWCSAMAQGQGMSLLVRAWHTTGDEHYLKAARRAVKPLTLDVTRGGLKRRLAGGPFFEEYPTTPPSHVLNGFMFTLIGLWDLSPWSPAAADLYRQSRRTLVRSLPLYDQGPGQTSAYHLGFRTAAQPVRTSSDYHDLHRAQLRVLHAIERDSSLAAFRKRWRPGRTRQVAVLPPE